ncbi:MAG: translation initiation factor eIF-1A [Candidatus Diapherotrites archaeon]|nr:translation initiation factor eIF-1A [Candidatus Diapherotrites archaeon]
MEENARIRLPKEKENELLGVVTKLLGANHLMVKCIDGKERLCRIPGRLRKKVWVRDGDLVIVKVWEFQDEKGDIVWRYLPNQANQLKRRGLLKDLEYSK